MKPGLIGLVGFIGGGAVASAAWSVMPPTPATAPAKPEPVVETTHRDFDLEKANANLTSSLQECDRRLTELGERPVPMPSPSASAAPDERRGRRGRGELTKDDWERMAENGVVPIRIPCIRDTPWTPSERVVDRLGLLPSDVEALKEAYAASNKRMVEAIRPLCAQALGSEAAADKVGASQCIDMINNTARKASVDETKAALTRVAEVQAGKREAPKPDANTSAVEKLGYLLTNEQKTFERELEQKLGPEDAKRLANDPGLCSDRKMLRAGDLDPSTFGGGRQRGGR